LKGKKLASGLKYFVLSLMLLVFLVPILSLVAAQFKSLGRIYDPARILSVRGLTLSVWKEAIRQQGFGTYLRNSVTISVSSTALVLLFSVPAAFGLAKLKMNEKTRKNLSFEFLAMRMMPGIAVVIPIFMIYKRIGLLYTVPGLVVIYLVFNIPLATWLLEGFFKEVPNEISEAARIDGCSERSELMRIIVPLSTPGIMAVGILTFIFVWNEYMFASVLSTSRSRTLPVWAAYTTYQHYIINYAVLGIASFVMIMPVIVFAILMQKYLVRGLSFGAIKE
jgi:ABC-type glycerol-3-phosphate transport system permease component